MDANKMETVIGPVIGDREFYLLLDTEKYPALSECITMFDSGDTEGAVSVFAGVARGVLLREKYFSLHSRLFSVALAEKEEWSEIRKLITRSCKIVELKRYL